MIQIRPVSDLRNKFSEIEKIVSSTQAPIFLTKNGHGAMVVMSIQAYARVTENLEEKLNEADAQAERTDERLSHETVFSAARNRIRKKA